MNYGNIAIFGLLFLIADVHSLMWYLEPNQQKCLKEEVQANVLVTGEYEVSEAHGQKVDYVVSFLIKLETPWLRFEVRFGNLQYGPKNRLYFIYFTRLCTISA